jgi:hypothetical protein
MSRYSVEPESPPPDWLVVGLGALAIVAMLIAWGR